LKVDTPRDLFDRDKWNEWKTYAGAQPLEKQIAQLEEILGEAHAMWKKGPVGSMKQNDKLELYSAFEAADFLVHSLHLRLDYSAPVDQLYGTDREAYDKIIGPRGDRMLYHVQNTLKEIGVNEEKLEKFATARSQYLDLVRDEAFMDMQRDFSRRSIALGNEKARAERQRLGIK